MKVLHKLVVFFLSFFPLLINAESRFARDERRVARQIRVKAASVQTTRRPATAPEKAGNGDEQNVANFAGSFSKCFEHDETTGVLTVAGQQSYEQLLTALKTGEQQDFNALVRAGVRKLANPQAANAFSLEGCDSSLFTMPAPPALSSAHAAAEMLEVYGKALCRDVRFVDYGTGENTDNDGSGNSITGIVAQALDDLGDAFKGPRNAQGHVDTSVLFRGVSPGDLQGPYVSQFLLQSLHAFNQPILQTNQYVPIASQREFGVRWLDFVEIQNGNVPQPYQSYDFDQDNITLITSGRDLGTLVHADAPGEFYQNAAHILCFNKFPLSTNLPYRTGEIINEGSFVTMGTADICCVVAGAFFEALKAAWVQKWRCFRRLRPEAMAGLVHEVKITGLNPYNLHSSLFALHNGIDILELVYERNSLQAFLNFVPVQDRLSEVEAQTYLLPLMYPEGSPTHPSYPAGHAVIAGACTTVLKALFDDTALFNVRLVPLTVDPNSQTSLISLEDGSQNLLTVGGELDKLASNIAIARNIAGVHYRSDGDDGILLGEEVAIRFLQDHARIYHEQGFSAFELTKRNGQRIRILPDRVEVIG